MISLAWFVCLAGWLVWFGSVWSGLGLFGSVWFGLGRVVLVWFGLFGLFGLAWFDLVVSVFVFSLVAHSKSKPPHGLLSISTSPSSFT